MVSISRRRVKAPSRRTRKVYDREKLGAFGLALIGVLYVAWSLLSTTTADEAARDANNLRNEQQDIHPQLNVQDPNTEAYNAIALDIIQTLDCHSLLNTTYDQQRRLEEEDGQQDADAAAYEEPMGMGDDYNGDGGAYFYEKPTGQHLFCLAALSSTSTETATWKDKIHCDATRTRQQTLLELWSEARSEISEFVLKKTLQVSIETERDLVGTSLHLWSPSQDSGVEYMLSHLNDEQKNVDYGGIYGLTENLGIHKLFVDVGSCLGITSMAIALLYPGTKIVSIEAASPNWLLQEMNWRCNDFSSHTRTYILSGVGPSHTGAQMAKFMWRPQATTSTRSWTPKEEHEDTDVELKVKLRPWHSLLAQAEIADKPIDVLNVDCEGCEYNLIPSLSDKEFDSITTVMGGIHWGYIPHHKLPSSKRGKETHQRLCKHENFARTAKECCDVPDLPVTSSVPGEVLVQDEKAFPPKSVTVQDVAGELCNDFDEWAKEHHLHSIDSDWGWFQITSMAD